MASVFTSDLERNNTREERLTEVRRATGKKNRF